MEREVSSDIMQSKLERKRERISNEIMNSKKDLFGTKRSTIGKAYGR